MSWSAGALARGIAGLRAAAPLAWSLQQRAAMTRLALLAALAAAPGCFDQVDAYLRLDERFEDPEAFAATWQVEGAPAFVVTTHPGEHGLRLRAPDAITAELYVAAYDDFSDGHWIEYTTSCPGTPDVGVRARPDGTWAIVIDLPTAPIEAGFERVRAHLPPLAPPYTLGALRVQVTDPRGACTIDNLRLMEPAPEVLW